MIDLRSLIQLLEILLLLLFFFFEKVFNLWRPLLMIALYHQNETPISFWCRQGLNPRSLIQLSETLTVELTRTHFETLSVELTRTYKTNLFCILNINISKKFYLKFECSKNFSDLKYFPKINF